MSIGLHGRLLSVARTAIPRWCDWWMLPRGGAIFAMVLDGAVIFTPLIGHRVGCRPLLGNLPKLLSSREVYQRQRLYRREIDQRPFSVLGKRHPIRLW